MRTEVKEELDIFCDLRRLKDIVHGRDDLNEGILLRTTLSSI